MRTSLCISNAHRSCGGVVDRGTQSFQRLDACSCSCHKAPARPKAATTPDVRKAMLERDGYRCRAQIEGVCTGGADHPHHVLQQSAGGDDEMDNLLTVCWKCHDWIHGHVADAERLGLLRRSGGAG